MLARVNDLSSEFRRVSKMQVVQTTRQIILDNVRLNNEMALIETGYTTVEGHNGKIRDQVTQTVWKRGANTVVASLEKGSIAGMQFTRRTREDDGQEE